MCVYYLEFSCYYKCTKWKYISQYNLSIYSLNEVYVCSIFLLAIFFLKDVVRLNILVRIMILILPFL